MAAFLQYLANEDLKKAVSVVCKTSRDKSLYVGSNLRFNGNVKQ